MTTTLLALIVYFLILIGFAIFSAFGVYHFWQFGYVGDLSKPVVIGYIIAASAIIFFSLILVLGTII